MDFKLSKKRAIFLVGQALFIILALSNLAAEADTPQQPIGREQLAAPTVANGSFEDPISSLNNWNVVEGSVDVLTQNENKAGVMIGASDGTKFIDLANATISQEVSGFTPGQSYVLRIDYWGYHTNNEAIKDAKVIIDGIEMRQGLFNGAASAGYTASIHSKEENDWIVCNEFEFTPSATSVFLQIESLESGSNGLLIDNIRIEEGSVTMPEEHQFDSLVLDWDGWRQLVNWSFDEDVAPLSDPENTGPPASGNPNLQDVPNPHLCGDSIPGWRVTRENVDRIGNWKSPSYDRVMDLGGHGPGAIAQTIIGLVPNSTYALEFYVARHNHWWSGIDGGGNKIYEDMVSHLWSNGEFQLEIVRTGEQRAEDGFERMEVELVSDESGKITFEIFSMNIDKGGNNAFDNFRIIKKQDPPSTTNPGNQASSNGETISLSISAFDSDDDDLNFSATGLPAGLAVQKIDKNSAVITGTITAAGTYAVELTVSDGVRSTSAEFDWVVNGL
ncbi:MAG: DUF642 domain-containing protein, partial [Bacteroidota bacterium]